MHVHVHVHVACACYVHVRAAHRNDLIEACALEQSAQLPIAEVLGAHALGGRKGTLVGTHARVKVR